jgi:hypothetical protein
MDSVWSMLHTVPWSLFQLAAIGIGALVLPPRTRAAYASGVVLAVAFAILLGRSSALRCTCLHAGANGRSAP